MVQHSTYIISHSAITPMAGTIITTTTTTIR